MEPVNRLRPLSLLTGSLCLSHSRPGSSRAARAEAAYRPCTGSARIEPTYTCTPLLVQFHSPVALHEQSLFTAEPAHRLTLSLSLKTMLQSRCTSRGCLQARSVSLTRATPLLRSDTCAYRCLYTSTPLPVRLYTFACAPLHLCLYGSTPLPVRLYTFACTPLHLCCAATPARTVAFTPLHLYTFACTPLHLCCAATPARTPSPDAPRAASLRSAVHELPHMTGHLSHTYTIGQTSLY
jgi:hypothetical protein